METTTTVTSAHRLKRVLTLWDLIFYGIVLIQPIAPVPLYGVAQKLSDGHFAAIILIAMFAMLITAVSYGRMAALYPSAGSAYTYVGKGLNPHLGFLAGWAMILDYLLHALIGAGEQALAACHVGGGCGLRRARNAVSLWFSGMGRPVLDPAVLRSKDF